MNEHQLMMDSIISILSRCDKQTLNQVCLPAIYKALDERKNRINKKLEEPRRIIQEKQHELLAINQLKSLIQFEKNEGIAVSDQFITLIKCFAKISDQWLILPGYFQRTISEGKDILLEAEFPVDFPREFAVYSLKKIIPVSSLPNISLLFDEHQLTITTTEEGRFTIFGVDKEIIKYPRKSIGDIDYIMTVYISKENLERSLKMGSIIIADENTPNNNFIVEAKKGELNLVVGRHYHNGRHSEFTILIGNYDKNLYSNVSFSLSHIKKIFLGNYTLQISKNIITKWSCLDVPLTYFIVSSSDNIVNESYEKSEY